jgi:hypothetical protein
VHISVINEGVDVPWTGLDLLESLLDRLVTGKIDLDRFNGVGRLWTLLVEGLDRMLGLLQRTTAICSHRGVICALKYRRNDCGRTLAVVVIYRGRQIWAACYAKRWYQTIEGF